MAQEFVLTVNGKVHSVQTEADTPLLYVLRNELGLNGPQFGCGLEQCGACLVLLGAKATAACKLPVAEIKNAAITTLEGLSAEGELHPVQRAFIEQQAAQCGYCLNGMIVATAALLWRHPQPSDEQICAALDGNLCRCGAHLRILRAVRRAADLMAEARGGAQTAEPTGQPRLEESQPATFTTGAGKGQNPFAANRTDNFLSRLPVQLDDWLAIEPDGVVRVYSGKVELGTGVRTALAQIVAEELDVPFERVQMIMGDTARTPDEGFTAGSKTIRIGGAMLRRAAATARQALLALASDHLDAAPDELRVQAGIVSVIHHPDRTVTYADLMGGKRFNRAVTGTAPLKHPADYRLVGRSTPRVDIPQKVAGQPSFIQDVRLPGMLHARMMYPPNAAAKLISIDARSVQDVPGLVKVVHGGNFIGVVAEHEAQAIRAAKQLPVVWEETAALPGSEDLYAALRAQPTRDEVLVETGNVDAALSQAASQLQATYYQPYQAHASLGPACAVADVREDRVTIWASTQGPYPLRGALAQLLEVPVEKVHLIHVEGAGCYGQNGADDVAAQAALLSRAVGRPVRLQWSREEEFVWEPKAAAMIGVVRGGLDPEGHIVAWDYALWSPTHTARPRSAGQLLAAQWLAEQAPPTPQAFFGAERNAPTNYAFPAQRVKLHWLANSPLRVSSFRSLGAAGNTFANESFMDELAAAAGVDALEFRLRYLADPRARAVLTAAAEKAGWDTRPARSTPRWRAMARAGDGDKEAPAAPGALAAQTEGLAEGWGMAFAQYENSEAYVATLAQVQMDTASGTVRVKRIVVAHDCGLIINPDGVKNQIEGNVIQSLSRTLKEEVKFDTTRITSTDWQSYPILTFSEVPQVDIVLINRPDQPAVGAGEPATITTAAAVANAIFEATGIRLRRVPFTPQRLQAAFAERTQMA